MLSSSSKSQASLFQAPRWWWKGGKSFSKKKCEKRAGAGERQAHFSRRRRPLSKVVRVLSGLEIKKILRSPFGDQLEKCSRQM